jgi:type I site-specific restriction-modification system R (restriction) subunit
MTNLPPSQEDIQPEEIFGEPISVYTDAQAVEDGFIVNLDKFTNVRFLGLPINRMARHLYNDLKPFAKSAADTL